MAKPSDSDQCAKYLKVVADSDRLTIIQCLQRGPKNVSAIAAELKKDLANVSHHLKILRRNGLVTTKKEGKYVRYALDENYFSRPEGEKTGCCLDLGCCQLDLSGES